MKRRYTVKKILFITLSNIGDAVLTLPSLDLIKNNFPQGLITLLVSARSKELFLNDPQIDKLIVYDKHASIFSKLKLFGQLDRERFDIIVDLRNTLFGLLLPARYKTSHLKKVKRDIHAKDKHLARTMGMGVLKPGLLDKRSLYPDRVDKDHIEKLLDLNTDERIVVISPGARSHIKRWAKESFVKVVDSFDKVSIVLVGDETDAPITDYIVQHSKKKVINLSGKTNLLELVVLLKRATLLITNDSAVLHLASYLDLPILALFGPTNENRYGPWSSDFKVLSKPLSCRPCEVAQCRFGHLKCMSLIKPEAVIGSVFRMLGDILVKEEVGYKRILIMRTDRIGDVLLSTPLIRAMRSKYPEAYIAMKVSPYTKEVVEGNPDLDEVIIYDKKHRDKSWIASFKFAMNLKKKKFDLVLILHPTNRAHIISFLARIPKRIGYD